MRMHNHSLIAIRDNFTKQRDRFLVYYDDRWDCKLFLNYKTMDRNNEESILDRVSADLGVDKDTIVCTYISSRVQEKYSVSHNEERVYNHRLYEITLTRYPEKLEQDNFVINKRHYYWMSIQDMEKDENIWNKNKEVVDFVKEKVI